MAPTPTFLAWLAHLFQLPAEVDEMQVNQLNMEVRMSKYTDEIAALNAETDKLSGRIDAVIARMSSDDPAVETELNAISARLRGIAADPEQPVPAEPEQPEQPVEPTEPTDPNAPVEGDQPA